MFKCEQCQQSSGGSPNRVVVERRTVNHLNASIPKGPRGGVGSQIVREVVLCAECAGKTAEAPIERAEPGDTQFGTVELDDETVKALTRNHDEN